MLRGGLHVGLEHRHKILIPYEALKELTRKNEKITQRDFDAFIDGLSITPELKAKLKSITPFNYTGV